MRRTPGIDLDPSIETERSLIVPKLLEWVSDISGTIHVSKYPALGDPPSNILRRSLERNRAQQGRMAGLRQLELSVLS